MAYRHEMKEICIYGRAGQGAITTAVLLSMAAFEEGKEVLAFPHFGAERMGAPMNAFVKIDEKPIRDRSQIQNPDYVLVLDQTLLRVFDVAGRVKPEGVVIVNSHLPPEELKINTKARVITVPAFKIAEEILGKAERANTAILGALSAAVGIVSLDSLKKAARTRFKGELGERNAQAIEFAYSLVK